MNFLPEVCQRPLHLVYYHKYVNYSIYITDVMDDKLPDGSGLDVAERIRSKGSEAPIILMSGYDASAVALRAEKFRIFDFLQNLSRGR